MEFVLWLTIYCTNPGPGPCPARTELAVQPHYITRATQAQCEELRDLILSQQPAPGKPRGFVLDAFCLPFGLAKPMSLIAPTGLRLSNS